MKAILEIDAPESCGECALRVDNLGYSQCPAARDKKGWPREVPHRHTSSARADFCPLRIKAETPEDELKPCPSCGTEGKAPAADPLRWINPRDPQWVRVCPKCRSKFHCAAIFWRHCPNCGAHLLPPKEEEH